MPTESTVELDETDWRILAALQRDGRLSYADLAREVAMSASAVTERVRRLEEQAVITSYRAVVDPHRVGLGILALIRLRYPTSNYRPLHALLDTTPEVIEAHHVTGEDCFVLKVAARSMRHLEEITGRIPEQLYPGLQLPERGEFLQISVRDTGIGIPAVALGTIFDRYMQAKSRRLSKTRGTGLGLAFCRKVMDAHQGYIWAESEEGKGSTFFLLFPLA